MGTDEGWGAGEERPTLPRLSRTWAGQAGLDPGDMGQAGRERTLTQINTQRCSQEGATPEGSVELRPEGTGEPSRRETPRGWLPCSGLQQV